MFRGDGWGRLLIDGLVGTHRAGVRDCMDCSIPLCLIPEIERKAGVHDLRRGVGIVLTSINARRFSMPAPSSKKIWRA